MIEYTTQIELCCSHSNCTVRVRYLCKDKTTGWCLAIDNGWRMLVVEAQEHVFCPECSEKIARIFMHEVTDGTHGRTEEAKQT